MAKGNQANQAPNHVAIGSGNRIAIDDSGSPFFLQNGDHPGLILVSHQLSGGNYNTWNRAMSMALTAKNKLGFVDNSIQRPHLDDLLYGAWLRCNSMVISWILNSVAKEIADSLMYIPTAYEIWIDLRDRFHQSNALRIFQIKKLLSGLHQGSMDVTTYYTRLRTLWDELKDFQPVSVCNCGSMKDWMNFQNQECVMQFLMGLNESYAQIRAQILMMDPVPIISKTFSLVVQEERQRSIQQESIPLQIDSNTPVPHSPNVAAVMKRPALFYCFKSTRNFFFFLKPHIASAEFFGALHVKSFSNVKGNRYDKLICSHCDGVGHTVDKCYKLHGYPPSHPKYKSKQHPGKAYANQARGFTTDLASSSWEPLLNQEQCKQLIAILSS
ncbi:uncharacterized protein LOC142548320 [Primulina tabacum]|uniref:uncharacterized protein LOC142548320 n=1 Tax=Primulina tabacum TaxID=48773 RepID=UPI003F59A8EF